jgi:hypothetical protein
LTLYLTAAGGSTLSISDYALVRATQLNITPEYVAPLIGTPVLTIDPSGYDPSWIGPRGGEHVIVDGLFNGWVTPDVPSGIVTVQYLHEQTIRIAYVVSGVALALVTIFSLAYGFMGLRSRIMRRRRVWPH